MKKLKIQKLMKYIIAWCIRIFIIILAIFGLFMCGFIYPLASLVEAGLSNSDSMMSNIHFCLLLGLRELCSIFCFTVLFKAWKISNYIQKGKFLTWDVYNRLKKCSWIFGITLFVFIVGNTILYFMEWNVFFAYAVIFSIIGLFIETGFISLTFAVRKAYQRKIHCRKISF